MKKHIIILFVSILCCSLMAQSEGELQEYRRNSLSTMMVYHSEDTFGMPIYHAFQAIPIPDKYDDHSFGWNVILNDSISGVKRRKAGLIKAAYGKQLSKSDIRKNGEALEKMLNKNQCAKVMVAKWFGMDLSNSLCNPWDGFNMSLIQQRGQYNASDLDVEKALNTSLGLAILSDAGEELLNNTFVLVNDMTYVTAEEKAAVAKVIMGALGGLLDGLTGSDIGSNLAYMGGAIADSYTGFTVKTHSYLLQVA
jgi:hypothetical protein